MREPTEAEREALGAFRHSLERAVETATGEFVRLTLSTDRARTLLDVLTPDDADVEESERDELWAALARVASNLCNCHADPGGREAPPVEPALHSETCSYACAHASIAEESTAPILWDDNFTLAQG